MKIIADLKKEKLTVGMYVITISNNVRSIANGNRRMDEVVRSIPGDKPYDPCRFPLGLWRITAVEWQNEYKFDPWTYGPVKIRTNAKQAVKVWELDADRDYLRETNEEVVDEGYLLHYSASTTTLGCIRISSPDDAIEIANYIQVLFAQGEDILLEVL